MGTVTEKLQAVLNSKNAIRDKFSLAEDLPFSQYAENIYREEFYTCVEINKRMPFRLTATADGTKFAFNQGTSWFNADVFANWYYRTNKESEWQKCNTINDLYGSAYLSMSKDDWVEFWGDSTECAGVYFASNGINSSSYNLLASGDIMSLFNYSDTVPEQGLREAFARCPLTNIPDLRSIKHIKYAGCYSTFANYYGGGSNIILNIDTLAEYGCYSMFYGVSTNYSPDGTPSIKAIINVNTVNGAHACEYMLGRFKHLSEIQLYCPSWSFNVYSDVFNNWVDSVPEGGTFYHVSGLTEVFDASHIPTGWTVVEFDPTADPIPKLVYGWSGKLLIKTETGYDESTTITQGLALPEDFELTVGNIYNADTTLMATLTGIPESSVQYTINLVAAPDIQGTVGEELSSQVVAIVTDSEGTVVGVPLFSAEGLPAGITINDTGLISGTPVEETSGTYTVNASYTDAADVSVNGTFTITAAESEKFQLNVSPTSINFNNAATIENSAQINVIIENESGVQVSDIPVFTLSDDAPSWITGAFDASTNIYNITGAAPEASTGSFIITVAYTNADSIDVSVTYDIQALRISLVEPSAPTLPESEVNTAVTAINFNHYYAILNPITNEYLSGTPTFSSTDLPEGLTLIDGILSGTPTAAGTGTFNITASYAGADDLIITLAYTFTAVEPEPTTSGNIVLAGWQDSLPTMGGGTTITSVNGTWTKGRWDNSTGFTEDSTAEGQEAGYQNADKTGIIYCMDGVWYLNPTSSPGYMSIYGSPSNTTNPYNDDGTSLTWVSDEGFTTGTILPEPEPTPSSMPTVTISGMPADYTWIAHYNGTYVYNAENSRWVNSTGDYIYWDENETEWKLVNGDDGLRTSLGGTENDITSIAGTKSVMFDGEPANICEVTITVEEGGSGDTPADPVYTITPNTTSITLTSLKGSDISTRLTFKLTDESGNVVDDEVTVTPNNMPSWLTINEQGMISGTAIDGSGEFTITLSHQYAQDVTVNVSYTIAKPEIVSIDIIPTINVEESTAITEIDLNDYYIVRDPIGTGIQLGTPTFQATSLPEGITLSGSTLSGSPTTAGEGNISILATYPGADDVTITLVYVITAKPSGGDTTYTGNIVLSGWQDSLPTMGGSVTITSVNGTWTKGRWDNNSFTEDSTAEGQEAGYQNADKTGIICCMDGTWWLNPNGSPGYMSISASPTGTTNPWNDDGTSLTWKSGEGFTTGTVLPEQGGSTDSSMSTVTISGIPADYTWVARYNGTYVYNAENSRWVNSSGDYIYWGGTDWLLVNGENGSTTLLGGTENDITSIAGTKSVTFHGELADTYEITITVEEGGGSDSGTTTITVTGFASVGFSYLDGTYTDDGTGVRFVNDEDYNIRWVSSSEAVMFGPATDQWCIVGADETVYACIGGTEGDVSSIACADKNIQLQVDALTPPVTIVVSNGQNSGEEEPVLTINFTDESGSYNNSTNMLSGDYSFDSTLNAYKNVGTSTAFGVIKWYDAAPSDWGNGTGNGGSGAGWYLCSYNSDNTINTMFYNLGGTSNDINSIEYGKKYTGNYYMFADAGYSFSFTIKKSGSEELVFLNVSPTQLGINNLINTEINSQINVVLENEKGVQVSGTPIFTLSDNTPSWISGNFDATTNIYKFAGISSNICSGSFTVTISYENTEDVVVTINYNIQQLQIVTTEAPITVLPESEINTAITAIDFNDYYAIFNPVTNTYLSNTDPTFSSTDLPEGLTLTDGILSGTPTAAGTGTFNITASYAGADDLIITLAYTFTAVEPEPTASGNVVFAGFADSVLLMGMPYVLNGTWTGGSYDMQSKEWTEGAAVEGQARAYLSPNKDAYLIYYYDRWYVDPNGGVGVYGGFQGTPTGTTNPWNEDGTSLTWVHEGTTLTGTVLPEPEPTPSSMPIVTISGAFEFINHYNDTYVYNAENQRWVNSSGDYIYWDGTEWKLINGSYNGGIAPLGGTENDITSIAGTKSVMFDGEVMHLCEVTITVEEGGSSGETETGEVILVDNAGTSSFNGTYKLVDTSATGNDRVWKHTDNNSYVFYWSGTSKWLMQVGTEVAGPPKYSSVAGAEDPWEGTWGADDGALPVPTVTLVEGDEDAGTTTYTGNLIVGGSYDPGTWTLGTYGTSPAGDTCWYEDATVTGINRIWKSPNGSYYLFKYGAPGSSLIDEQTDQWVIQEQMQFDMNMPGVAAYTAAGLDDPWAGTWSTWGSDTVTVEQEEA